MSDQLRLDIPLLLPEVADTADRCVARLTSELEGREGVDKVHVIRTSDGSPPQLCIHYRPDILPLERVRQLARSAGAELTRSEEHTSELQSLMRISYAVFCLKKKKTKNKNKAKNQL